MTFIFNETTQWFCEQPWWHRVICNCKLLNVGLFTISFPARCVSHRSTRLCIGMSHRAACGWSNVDSGPVALYLLTQLNSTQLTTPKEKSGLQEERSYKSLYKSPILQ